jgi:hypothetical protein
VRESAAFWSAALFRRFGFLFCAVGAAKKNQSGGKAPHSKKAAVAQSRTGI